MAKKKPDSLCFDISSLNRKQKVSFAKSLKNTVDGFNEELEESKEQENEE